MHAFLALLAGRDPVRPGGWACADAADEGCTAALASGRPGAACALPAGTWHLTGYQGSYAAEFGAVCGRRWQGQLATCLFFLGCAAGVAGAHALSEHIGA